MANNWQFQLQLPDRFSGEKGETIRPWFQKLEFALRAVEVDLNDNEFGQRMCTIIPVRLTGAADKVFRSIPEDVRNDYDQLKQEMCRIFNNDQFMKFI